LSLLVNLSEGNELIDPAILQRLRHGVCAIGYLTEPLADARPHTVAGWFKVVGSGFLVRKETVITNRHVSTVSNPKRSARAFQIRNDFCSSSSSWRVVCMLATSRVPW
jgi:fructose 1,6-bisphosphatase